MGKRYTMHMWKYRDIIQKIFRVLSEISCFPREKKAFLVAWFWRQNSHNYGNKIFFLRAVFILLFFDTVNFVRSIMKFQSITQHKGGNSDCSVKHMHVFFVTKRLFMRLLKNTCSKIYAYRLPTPGFWGFIKRFIFATNNFSDLVTLKHFTCASALSALKYCLTSY